jgi:hypothetical protein
MFRTSILLLTFWIITGIEAHAQACHPPLQSMQQIELLFGRNIDGKLGVSDRAWAQFLAETITPQFPDGLTVSDGAGQWRSKTKIVRERSKIVMILTREAPDLMSRLDAIVADYKRRFRQQSVGVVVQPVCAGFP